MNLKIMGYVDIGPQQVSAIGQCLPAMAIAGFSPCLAKGEKGEGKWAK